MAKSSGKSWRGANESRPGAGAGSDKLTGKVDVGLKGSESSGSGNPLKGYGKDSRPDAGAGTTTKADAMNIGQSSAPKKADEGRSEVSFGPGFKSAFNKS